MPLPCSLSTLQKMNVSRQFLFIFSSRYSSILVRKYFWFMHGDLEDVSNIPQWTDDTSKSAELALEGRKKEEEHDQGTVVFHSKQQLLRPVVEAKSRLPASYNKFNYNYYSVLTCDNWCSKQCNPRTSRHCQWNRMLFWCNPTVLCLADGRVGY